jgi:WD40 repeat protein
LLTPGEITLHQTPYSITHIAFSLDGKQLASASTDQTVKVWDSGTWKLRATLQDDDAVLGVAFSPDGLRVACASQDRTVKTDRTAAGRCLRECRCRGGGLGRVHRPEASGGAGGFGLFQGGLDIR